MRDLGICKTALANNEAEKRQLTNVWQGFSPFYLEGKQMNLISKISLVISKKNNLELKLKQKSKIETTVCNSR